MDRSVLQEIETSGRDTIRKLKLLKSSLDTDELVFNLRSLGSDLVLFLENAVERSVLGKLE